MFGKRVSELVPVCASPSPEDRESPPSAERWAAVTLQGAGLLSWAAGPGAD